MRQGVGHPDSGESVAFDGLLLSLYGNIGGTNAWRDFLSVLCNQLHSDAATLVLRQPARGDRGDLFSVNTTPALEEVYRTTPFPDDPFNELEEGVACSIFDRVDRDAFARSRFYNDLLKLDNNIDILAMNVSFGESYTGYLRITRRHPARVFGLLEKSLLMRLYVHLKTALELFERSHRAHLENNAYIRAIDQLAFGVIIINERGHVVRVNETASRLMKDNQLLRVVGNHLHASTPDAEAALATALQSILSAPSGATSRMRSLKIVGKRPGHSLYALLKSIHEGSGLDGGAESDSTVAGVAIFMSADNLHRSVSIDTFAKLYGISRAETMLISELLNGVPIIEASNILGISENTARAQLRSVFAKTGTNRQTDLIRLVLTSLAIIA